jgi:hypothetical protein
LAYTYFCSICHADIQLRFINVNLVEATSSCPHFQFIATSAFTFRGRHDYLRGPTVIEVKTSIIVTSDEAKPTCYSLQRRHQENASWIRFASPEQEVVESITGNARFFSRSGPHTLAVVAAAAGGIADQFGLLLEGLAPLQTAGPNEVSFLDNRRYASALDQTLAGAVIVHPDMAARVPTGTVAILTSEPYAGWARVAALFYPVPPVSPGIHPSAIVAEGALRSVGGGRTSVCD